MELTRRTDFALRTLLYLGAHPGRPVPTTEVARAYGISRHHAAQVGKDLVALGHVAARRGRGGGLVLARPPEAIVVGAVVRETEPSLDLLECFARSTNTCPLAGACALERCLHAARAAFLAVLDRTTLADLLVEAPALRARLGRRLAPS